MTENIDFSFPEDVLIQVKASSKRLDKGWTIIGATILGDGKITGAASYEDQHSGFLVYALKDLVSPIVLEDGFYVITAVSADISKGDGWTTDDDITWYCSGFRPATEEEISLY